jgi:hypothetical protein
LVGVKKGGILLAIAIIPVPIDEEGACSAPGEWLHVSTAEFLFADIQLEIVHLIVHQYLYEN